MLKLSNSADTGTYLYRAVDRTAKLVAIVRAATRDAAREFIDSRYPSLAPFSVHYAGK